MSILFPSLKKIKKMEKILQKLNTHNLPQGKSIKLADWLNLAFSISEFLEVLDLSSGFFKTIFQFF